MTRLFHGFLRPKVVSVFTFRHSNYLSQLKNNNCAEAFPIIHGFLWQTRHEYFFEVLAFIDDMAGG